MKTCVHFSIKMYRRPMKIYIVIVTDERVNILGAFANKELAKREILLDIERDYEDIEDSQTLLKVHASLFGSFFVKNGYIDGFGRILNKNFPRPQWQDVEYIFYNKINKYSECEGIVSQYKIVEEELEL